MISFPGNKKFAFTIFDDTDLSTVENVAPVYRLLHELGLRTTKSVWPLESAAGARFSGSSLQETDYLRFILGLKEQGFEIALHNVRNASSRRAEIQSGLEEFRRLLGDYPRVHANHSSNRDNIYWGADRFRKIASFYRIAAGIRRSWPFEGHVADSDFFWGDYCRQRIDYVRNFVFREINLLRINPSMPYHDPKLPYVNAWFSSADGADMPAFSALLSEANQDRLEEEGGVCIVYTHLACGFADQGRVHPRVETLLRRLARKNGWFAPVSTLLDLMREQRGPLNIPDAELAAMERLWLKDRLAIAISRTAAGMLGRKSAQPKNEGDESQGRNRAAA
jgi:hypothetical protein